MPRTRKLFILPVLLVSLLALTACPSQTSISKLKADPDRYMDKEVGIVGRVTDSYGVPFVGGAYELDDGTGKIWVLTERGAPGAICLRNGNLCRLLRDPRGRQQRRRGGDPACLSQADAALSPRREPRRRSGRAGPVRTPSPSDTQSGSY